MDENTKADQLENTTSSKVVLLGSDAVASIAGSFPAVLQTEGSLANYAAQINKLINPAFKDLGKSSVAATSFLHEIIKSPVLPSYQNGIYDLLRKDANASRNYTAIEKAIMGINSLKGVAAALQPIAQQIINYQHNSLLAGQFALPIHSEILSLTQILQPKVPALSVLQGAQAAMAGMKHPWLDTHNKLGSLTAFIQLHDIGKRLQIWKPYGPTLTAYLRPSLGDWREKMTFSQEAIENVEARRTFYDKLGFNHSLTEFPQEALDETLTTAGIIPAEISLTDMLGNPFNAPSDLTKRKGLELINKAYYHLSSFEIAIRKFIDENLAAEFGTDWHKSQLPNGLFDKWIEKKNKYEKAKQLEPHARLIEFADFTDYESIINRGDNWKRVFAKFFQRQENVRETFQRLHPIRLDTMHARLITQDDYLLLFVELTRIRKACRL